MKVIKFVCNAIGQYLKEVIIMCFILYEWCNGTTCIISIVVGLLAYILIGVATIFIYAFRSPRKCKILHLSQKTVCMKPLYYKNKQQFVQDFEKIVTYAKNKGYTYIDTKTHELILHQLLGRYIVGKSKPMRDKCRSMEVNSCIETDTEIGTFLIKRIPDDMNRCARFEYNRIMNRKQFIRTFRRVKRYNIIINFKELS